MKCLEFPKKPFEQCKFEYPDEMKKLIDLLEADGIKINCDFKTLEKLWFAYSETWSAYFLTVGNNDKDDTYPRFLEWVKDFDLDTAEHMNYEGDQLVRVCRPWDDDEEDSDETE